MAKSAAVVVIGGVSQRCKKREKLSPEKMRKEKKYIRTELKKNELKFGVK